tara:strand:+ start:3686 stop:5779 length:2094 start_codon:yes stop_codon:yes gene_type:complete
MMYQQPPFPMQPMADQMAQQGRFGDSMMVHMNPIEVAGIASLSPTGQLTTNPMTGQPEAFLPFLAPLLGSLAGSALAGGTLATSLGLGGLGSAAMGAIGSGLATTAVTGDIKEGLVSGLTGFGIGKALGAAKDIVGGVTEATEAVTAAEKALAKGTETATQEAVKAGTDLARVTQNPVIQQLEAGVGTAKDALAAKSPATTGELLTSGKGLAATGKALLTPGAAIPIAIGEGERAAMARRQEMEEMFGRRSAQSEEDLRRAEEALDSGRFLNVTGEGYGKYDYLGDDPYFPTGMAEGGITAINPQDFRKRQAELYGLAGEMPPVKRMQQGGPFPPNFNPAPTYGLGGSSAAQAAIRGSVVVDPKELEGYRPGFDPEIKYFRDPTPEEIEASEQAETTTTPTTGASAPSAAVSAAGSDPNRNFSEEQSLYEKAKATVDSGFGSQRKRKAAKARVERYEREFGLPGSQESVQDNYYRAPPPPATAVTTPPATVVEAPSQTTMVASPQAGTGIESILQANLADSNIDPATRELIMRDVLRDARGMTRRFQEGGPTNKALEDAQKLLEQTRMAILGRLDEDDSETIIQRFIDEFGIEVFQALRSSVLEEVVPGSQKEGLIDGLGGGMDDLVPGMIGDQQPVAVSPGEFIVPADVVSGLGDGDTDAGAEDLEQMMDRVRMERTGTTEQPQPLMAKKGGILPA